MVPEPRSEFNFSWPRIFSAARNNFHLPCCLLSMHIARAHGRDSHAGEGMLDSLAPSIYHLSFMVGLIEESSLAEMNLKDLQIFSK
jgi:hypothetical protein